MFQIIQPSLVQMFVIMIKYLQIYESMYVRMYIWNFHVRITTDEDLCDISSRQNLHTDHSNL